MVAPKHWRTTIEQALAELGYTTDSHRDVWCYDLLLLPTFHASGWVRIACDGDETYTQIAFFQGSERVEDVVIVTEETSARFLAQMTAIQPSALVSI